MLGDFLRKTVIRPEAEDLVFHGNILYQRNADGNTLIFVDSPGIGPGPRQCECRVIPLYYEPETRTEYTTQSPASTFGLPGIEPGLQDPQPCVLPLYDSPFTLQSVFVKSLVGPPGIEPGLYEPESHVLPVYYGPTKNSTRGDKRRVHLSGFEPETFRM